nr:hypothetical protein [Virgibacillus sp. Bac330]
MTFTPGRFFSNNFSFDGTDTLTIQEAGTYYLIGTLMPSTTSNGPFGVAISLNGNIVGPFGLYGANYGTSAGQEVVAFGLENLAVGDTISLVNISPLPISIGGTISGVQPSSRLVVYRIF